MSGFKQANGNQHTRKVTDTSKQVRNRRFDDELDDEVILVSRRRMPNLYSDRLKLDLKLARLPLRTERPMVVVVAVDNASLVFGRSIWCGISLYGEGALK